MNKEQAIWIQDKIDRLKLEILEELKKEEEKTQEKLHAVNMDGWIYFKYKGEDLGHINGEGGCSILSDDFEIKAYNQWRKDGMLIDTESIIEWRGGKYGFDKDLYFERKDVENSAIYSFDACIYSSGCMDDNIKRHGHNLRPIGY